MKKSQIEAIFRLLQKANPQPRTELCFDNHFQLLIAVMLSAQATDIAVNKATPALFKKAPHPEKMIELGVDGIKHYIKTIGLYNTKAKKCVCLLSYFTKSVSRKNPLNSSGIGKLTRCR